MYGLIKPILFAQDPEAAHHRTLSSLATLSHSALGRAALRAMYGLPVSAPVTVCGLKFPNRVGLAAGMDKDALAWRGFAALGCGHVEIGTVTPRPQSGNSRPRVFRLVQDEAIINRMGFPGAGMEAVAKRLNKDRPHGVVVGLNVGKNKDTPLAEAASDYVAVVRRLGPLVDYITVNVSSPNTPGLRQLQTREYLQALLSEVGEARGAVRPSMPVFVKLSPDLERGALEDAIDAARNAGVDGVVATNTTVERPPLSSAAADEAGGLSGRPLGSKASEFIRRLSAITEGRLPIIAVGGIMTPDDAAERINAGASLVQVYTGLVYRGPSLFREIAGRLATLPSQR